MYPSSSYVPVLESSNNGGSNGLEAATARADVSRDHGRRSLRRRHMDAMVKIYPLLAGWSAEGGGRKVYFRVNCI